jgi:2-dehydro-3-deoxyphosphogluconate aldolase/(4S)-4-hydroxy-2-oxoglutarate aldolase
MTPSEMVQVQDDGISLIKVFPANSLGAGFVKSVKEVFPDLMFMSTGGVDSGNLEAWFRAGVSAVGLGSSLISKSLMDNRDYEGIKINTRALMNQIAAIRSSL